MERDKTEDAYKRNYRSMKSEKFSISEKFFETVKSVHIYFSLFRIRKKSFFLNYL